MRDKHYTDKFFLSNFVSGLEPVIKHMVKLLKPATLYDAINLAKLQVISLSHTRPDEQKLPQLLPNPNVGQRLHILTVTYNQINNPSTSYNQNHQDSRTRILNQPY